MKTNILKGNLKIFFNSLLALFKKKIKTIQNICIRALCLSFPCNQEKTKYLWDSRANYNTYLLCLLHQKSYKYLSSYLYAEVAFKIGASLITFCLKKKKKSGKTKSMNKSTTKVQQVTFFSKENLIRATTSNKSTTYVTFRIFSSQA